MIVVMGMGNLLKSDDNIGNIVVSVLKNRSRADKRLKEVLLIEAGTAPESFIHPIRKAGASILYIIDAAEFAGKVGDINVLPLDRIEETGIRTTHNIPIGLLNDMLSNTEIRVIAIKVASIEPGDDLTKDIKDNLDDLVDKVHDIISQ